MVLLQSFLRKRQNSRFPCPSSSPPQVGSQLSFFVSCGQDYLGSDLVKESASSLGDCVDLCALYHGLPRCVAVAYEADSLHGPKNCYLKNSVPALVTDSYIMDSAAAIWPDTEEDCKDISDTFVSNGVGFDMYCGKDYPLNDEQGNRHADSMEDCMKQCASSSSSCAGVSYEASMAHSYFNCYFKYQVSTGGLKTQSFPVDTAFINKAKGNSQQSSSIAASSLEQSTLTSASELISTSITASYISILSQPSVSTTTLTTVTSSALTAATTPTNQSPSSSTSSSPKAWIAGAVVGPIAGIAIVALLCLLFYKRGTRARQQSVPPPYQPAVSQTPAAPSQQYPGAEFYPAVAAVHSVPPKESVSGQTAPYPAPESQGYWGQRDERRVGEVGGRQIYEVQ